MHVEHQLAKETKLEGKMDITCDAPKPGGPLTNRQPMENSWISGDPIPHCYVPFTRIHNFNKKSDRVSFVRGALSKIQPVQNIVTCPIRGPI